MPKGKGCKVGRPKKKKVVKTPKNRVKNTKKRY